MLVKALTLAERAAEVSGLPYLKGAVGFALEVAQCVQVRFFDVIAIITPLAIIPRAIDPTTKN
jgi:hypothetical protein